MPDQKQPDELLQGLKQLVQQYTELNTILLRDGSKILARLVANPGQATNWQRINSDVLRPSTAAWLSLSQQHVENLLELGKVVTHRFQTILDGEVPVSPEPGAQTVVTVSKPEPSPRPQILLKGHPGVTIRASFSLNSSNREVQNGQFVCTPFFQENTGKAAGFQPVFQPSNFSISPDSTLQVEISTQVPAKLKPASYRSTVVVLGFDQTAFDVVLSIEKKSADDIVEPKTNRNKSKNDPA